MEEIADQPLWAERQEAEWLSLFEEYQWKAQVEMTSVFVKQRLGQKGWANVLASLRWTHLKESLHVCPELLHCSLIGEPLQAPEVSSRVVSQARKQCATATQALHSSTWGRY